MEALTVQANYIANSDKDSDSYGLSALYAFDFGLDFAVAAAGQDAEFSVDEQDQVTLGAAYSLNDLYLAATYAMGSVADNDDFTSLEVAAQYKFTKEFRLIGIYTLAEEDDEANTVDTADFFALEAQYRFNSSIRTYASYKLNNLDNKDDALMLGLRYNF